MNLKKYKGFVQPLVNICQNLKHLLLGGILLGGTQRFYQFFDGIQFAD